jgi:sugar phosphate permease
MSILVLLIGVTSSIAVLCWSVGKEVSNPKLAGMSMSIVNVFGFIFAAILMVVCGKIIDINTTKGLNPAVAYPKAFIVIVVSSIIALVFALLTTETRGENIYNK